MPVWIIVVLLTLNNSKPLAQYCYAESNIYTYETWYSVPVFFEGDYQYSYLDIDTEYITIDNGSVDYSCISYYSDETIVSTFYRLSDYWLAVDIDRIVIGQIRSPYVTRLYRNLAAQ